MAKSSRPRKRGGGRPSNWNNSSTSTLRVPTILTSVLLEIAHQLDQGLKVPLVIDPEKLRVYPQTKVEQIPQRALRIYKSSGKKVIRLEDLIEILQAYSD